MNKPVEMKMLKELMVDQAALAARLRKETSGEVMTDSASRGRYATDASIYQAMPAAVFVPKTAQDIASALQIAAEMALQNGAHAADVFNTVSVVADAGAVPLVMSYWNLIERYGVERFSADLANANGVGVITADLTPEEAGPWIDATDANGIDRIFLVAPSSTDARLKIVTDATSGFVYAASLMGVTGTRASVSSHAAELVARTRKVTDLPIAVGLGVSTPEQAAEVAKYADGVIVGSAYIKAILDAPSHEEAVVAVRAFSAALAQGVRR